jgi:hypothetical protein
VSPGSVQPLEDLAEAFNLRHRVLYDFVRICAAFDIFRRGANNYLEWRSLTRARDAINRFRVEVDAEGDNPDTLKQFRSSVNPSLQFMGVAIVKLFFSLDLKFLNLRKVGRVFAHGQTKYKTKQRKLYTVVGRCTLWEL